MKPTFPIDDVVPHSGTMSLLQYIEDYGDDWLCARACIKKDNLFLIQEAAVEGIPSWVAIEYMAQTIAAFAGIQGRLKGEQVKIGFLVGTRKFTVNTALFPLNCDFSITIKQIILGENGLGIFECAIDGQHDGQQLQASANLNVFQPENIDEILKK